LSFAFSVVSELLEKIVSKTELLERHSELLESQIELLERHFELLDSHFVTQYILRPYLLHFP